MAFRWNVQFRDVRFPGAYTGLFRSRANDQLLLLDTTTGLSYRTLAGIRYVLVDRSMLRSNVVYTVAYEKRGKDGRIRVMLLADGVTLFDDYISNMREFDSCYFGVFQNNGGALSARAIFVDNIEYAPIGDNAGPVPEASCLYRGYPNPFNARVCIEYDVAASGPVSLRIYNAAGELVADLAGGVTEPGRYSAIWEGRDRSGADVASGVYFCSFVTPETKQNRKLVLVR